ncbi:MAG: ROK family protein [Verrucomicrobia bacterium]|nr:ROK family protein [Verrucomicrobiota bacterium]
MAKPTAKPAQNSPLKILVIDIGGSHVKMSCSGHSEIRRFPSGPRMTPSFMIQEIKRLTSDWNYDVISMGCPMPIKKGKPIKEPANLGNGWVGFNYEKAFDRPTKIINDAAMQALGDYEGGRILFLGFGTGLGSTLIEEGVIVPLELSQLPYKKGTFEKYVSNKALEKKGKKKWTKEVFKIIEIFRAALEPEEIVLGGGNAQNLQQVPKGCRVAENSNAFIGGFRLWKDSVKKI